MNGDGYGGESTAILIDKALEHQNALGVSDNILAIEFRLTIISQRFIVGYVKISFKSIISENKQGNG